MKKILILLFLSFSVLAQEKAALGMNLPLLLDNVLELSLQKSFNKNISGIFVVGGTTGTRGENNNGNYGYRYGYNPNKKYSINVNDDNQTKGVYNKIGVFFNFILPDFDSNPETSGFKFFIGPIVASSSSTQTATIEKTTFPVFDEKGLIKTPSVITSTLESEKLLVFETGFSMGVTITSKKAISANLGLDLTKLDLTNSKFENSQMVIGQGLSLFARINYAIGKKKS